MHFKKIFLLVLSLPSFMGARSARVLKKNRLIEQENMITFRLSDSFDVRFSDSCIASIQNKHADLNRFNSTFFNPRFLKKTPHVQRLLSRPCGQKKEHGNRWKLQMNDSIIEGTFFDRSSEIVVFITGGFSNAHEYMAPFVKLFPDFDLVLFDLPGHGSRHEQDHNSRLNALVNVDLSQITFGHSESAVIQQVVTHFLAKKKYSTVAAVGRCYSVPFFARAALEWQEHFGTPLFDKFILDSAFVSFARFIPHFPALYCSRYPAPVVRHVGGSWLIGQLFYVLTEYVLGTSFADFKPTYEYISQLTNTDLLFVHSKADIAIPMADFELLWSKLDHIKNKGALFTTNKHAMSHIRQKEIYKEIAERFISNDFTDFASSLTIS